MPTKKERRLAAKRAQAETRSSTLSSWDLLSAGGPAVGPVNARVAENLSAVLACVGAISCSLASIPLLVYRRNGEGNRVEDPDHPLARMSRDSANQWQTWPDFIEWLVAQILLQGNGLAEIVTDGAGDLVELRPFPWSNVNPQLLPNGRLVYDASDVGGLYGGTGRMRRLLSSEVLHVRDRTDDGLIGRSRLSRAAASVRSAVSTQRFASKMWANQATPAGVVSMKKALTPEALGVLREQFEKLYSGAGNARRTIFLDNEMEWNAASISPEDAELLASRRFSVEEICRLFQVPPVVVGDLTNASFTNAETLLRFLGQFTLSAWARKIEAALTKSVLTADERGTVTVEFDLSGFLRGDPATRWNAHKIAVEAGILTTDEVREIEGFNPRGEAAAS